MDKAIIFGVYNFVSFHACKGLLNKGVEVTGVHLDVFENDSFLEEKRLEIGRNANYFEHTLNEMENSCKETMKKTGLIFSIYDLYMLNKETILLKEKFLESVKHHLERNNSEINMIFILPIQMVYSDIKMAMNDFLDQARACGKPIQAFYLPCIYGPWQPETFLFQQTILSRFQQTKANKMEREWTRDVLYVDDAIAAMFDIIESRNDGSYILESGKKNYWFDCASYLHIEDDTVGSTHNEPLEIDNKYERVIVNKVTPVPDSIPKQIEQVQYLYQNGS